MHYISVWLKLCSTLILVQAFLDFCGFDSCDFCFNTVYNSILFSSPLVLLSNLNLRSLCFRIFLCPHFKRRKSRNACTAKSMLRMSSPSTNSGVDSEGAGGARGSEHPWNLGLQKSGKAWFLLIGVSLLQQAPLDLKSYLRCWQNIW